MGFREKLIDDFKAYDTDGNGSLSVDELKEILMRPVGHSGFNVNDADEFVQLFDKNGDGVIDLHEFIEAMEEIFPEDATPAKLTVRSADGSTIDVLVEMTVDHTLGDVLHAAMLKAELAPPKGMEITVPGIEDATLQNMLSSLEMVAGGAYELVALPVDETPVVVKIASIFDGKTYTIPGVTREMYVGPPSLNFDGLMRRMHKMSGLTLGKFELYCEVPDALVMVGDVGESACNLIPKFSSAWDKAIVKGRLIKPVDDAHIKTWFDWKAAKLSVDAMHELKLWAVPV